MATVQDVPKVLAQARNGHAAVNGEGPEDAEQPQDSTAALAEPDDGDVEAPPIGEEPVALSLAHRAQALLFVAAEPVTLGVLGRVLDATRREVERAMEVLAEELGQGGLRLQRAEGAVQLVTAPEAAEDVRAYLGRESQSPLSRAALEALSIIAYRQPLTRPEIDELRGVNSDGVVRTLLARGLVEPLGRRETVGYPIEYGTTFAFLEYFGLSSVDELPPIERFPAGEAQPGDDGADFLADARSDAEAALVDDEAA